MTHRLYHIVLHTPLRSLLALLIAAPSVSTWAADSAWPVVDMPQRGQTAGEAAVVKGRVVDEKGQPVVMATVTLADVALATVTNEHGEFTLPLTKDLAATAQTLKVECLGFASQQVSIAAGSQEKPLHIVLKEDNLKLDEVVVTASRNSEQATTAYTIGRMAMDNQQVVNLSSILQLLPGGKTANATLMDDSRLALRAGSSEMGNAAFGTAIEIDGIRLSNNAAAGETTSASTRAVSSAAIAEVEVVPGVASVEYGDMANGVVRVRTRHGQSPFIFDAKVSENTRQVALSKGWLMGGGVWNATLEHARSYSDAASPHTAYRRNALTLNYQRTFWPTTMPLTLDAAVAANVGGYKSDSDPDRELDSYSEVRDNTVRGSLKLRLQPAKPWLQLAEVQLTANYADRLTTDNSYTSSSSTQPYIHTATEGYAIAERYEDNPDASIILGPTGYWYVKSYNGSRPLDINMKAKAQWSHRLGGVQSLEKVGLDYAWSHNYGRGLYYDDPATRPTHRYYEYRDLPALRTLGLYAEDRLSANTLRGQRAQLTIGLRYDRTMIHRSAYGSVGNWSPRLKGQYYLVEHGKGWLRSLNLHAGWGKSVKLPSFQVLYPRETYSDHLSFASPTTATGTSFYAYHTYPATAQRNGSLKHQYALQTDIGLQANVLGTRISLSYYHTSTRHSYMATNVYTPFTYLYTPVSSLSGVAIPSAQRLYSVDSQTGYITVSDASGQLPSQQLAANSRRTYLATTRYVNASPITRQGLEWVVDFTPITPLHTEVRVDGNYYSYRGLDETLFADVPISLNTSGSDGQPFSYIGYYKGANATSTSYTANAAVSNGGEARQVNLNATITTHIPRLRLIMALRVETTLFRYSRALSKYSDGTRGYVADDDNSNFGQPYDGSSRDERILVYPEYYSTWDNPDELIPFAEKYAWARDNDRSLYNDLTQLVVRGNYAYTMNPNYTSKYYSANFSVTKEIGDHVQVSFYANNFLNNMRRIRSSQTGLETSLFASGYIPSYYYGLALKLKL